MQADWSDRAAARPPAPAAGELRDPVAGPPIIVDTDNRPFEDITLESEGISVEDILGIDDGMHELGDDNSPTDEFEVLRDVPDSLYPDEDEEPEDTASRPDSMFAVENEPAATADDAALTAPPGHCRR